jgi:hypothetical protein
MPPTIKIIAKTALKTALWPLKIVLRPVVKQDNSISECFDTQAGTIRDSKSSIVVSDHAAAALTTHSQS